MEYIENNGNRIIEENLRSFFDIFNHGESAAVLIDTLNEVNIEVELKNHFDLTFQYYDLSKIQTGDSDRILGEIQRAKSKAVILDNIDKIPKIQDDWLVKVMVKNALGKEKSLPTHDSSLKRSVHFSEYCVGARCENWPPEYLEGASLSATPINLRYGKDDKQ